MNPVTRRILDATMRQMEAQSPAVRALAEEVIRAMQRAPEIVLTINPAPVKRR